MSLLALEESPHFVSLYDATQRGLVDRVLKAPLYPFAWAWLLMLERWRGWTSKRLVLRSLSARPGRVEVTCYVGRLYPFVAFVMRAEQIERLTFSVGPEGSREVEFTVHVRYRHRTGRVLEGEASFGVVDVDTHREAMALLMRIARMLGCASYRRLPAAAGQAGTSVELLLGSEVTKAAGYRDPGRPGDVEPVPDDDDVVDFSPREHGGFVEPADANVGDPRPERFGIDVWEPGTRVVAGERTRPWMLVLLPLLSIGWLLLWLLAAVIGGAIFGTLAMVIVLVTSAFGIDTFDLLMNDTTSAATFAVSGVIALIYVVPPGVAVWQQALGSRVSIDWEGGYVEQRGGLSRTTMPIGQVRGVDVRSSFGTRRLLLLTAHGDVALASGDEELTAVAVALGRALDVPVSHPGVSDPKP